MTTALELTAEEVDTYRRAACRRSQEEQRRLARRQQRAWDLARQVAAILRKSLGLRGS